MSLVTDLRERPPDRTDAARSSGESGEQAIRIGYAARAATFDADQRSWPSRLPSADRRMPVRCSFAQEQFWFIDQLTPGNLAYNFSWPVRLRGALDADALRRALDEIVRRHESLRTGFAANEEGEPVQVIGAGDEFALDTVDVSAEPDPEGAAHRLVDEESQRPFDLRHRGLFRARLIHLSDTEHVLHLVVHHIVFDEWSKVVLYRELATLYGAYAAGSPTPLPAPRVQYADFAAWQRSELTDATLAPRLDYWTSELRDAPTALELPTDRPRPAVASLRGGRRRLPLPPRLTTAMEKLARNEGATFFEGALALLEVLLHRYTGEEDFLVGAPADNRSRPELEETIGVLLNTVVIRSDLAGIPTFRALLRRVRERVRAASEHAGLPFELLVRTLQPQRDLSRHPLFQVLLAVNPPDPPLALAGLETDEIHTEVTAAGVDLFLFLHERDEGFDALWEYSSDLFDPETIDELHAHFIRLLEAVAADPDRPVDELSMLSETERRRLLVEWNGPSVDYAPSSLHSLVEAQAAASPGAVAAVFDGTELTYADLNARANQLARHLRAAGVGTDSLVAVTLDRSLDLLVALLGILKAGGAYVPLDPELPQERLAFMLDDSNAGVLVTLERLQAKLPSFNGRVVGLDSNWAEIAAGDTNDLDIDVHPDHLAYVIYTSGSTGKPKGVLNTHRGIVNRLRSMQETYRLDASDRLLQKTQTSFDVSVREVFWPLIFGATIVIARPGEHGNPVYLADLIEREQVTTLHFVPSMLQLFLEEVDTGKCRSLACVLCGGEALPNDLVQRFFERFDCELHNLYGPTEAAVSVTAWRCERSEAAGVVPIGRPVANTQIYVLDSHLEPVPAGVWGELFVGGVQVARGYHERPSLTAERFIPNPFGAGRMYRTGDIGRWNRGGAIEFAGRIDGQVKLRGFRIELGEIEAVLREHEAVAESAVVSVESPAGQRELAAYVVLSRDAAADPPAPADLQAFIRMKLPEYMVPATLTTIDGLPLLPSGKLDRNALPSPERRSPDADLAEPQTESEHAIAALWGDLLGVDRVGKDDNFFAVGGHSLLAARLVGRVCKTLGAEVQLCTFMQEPTVAALARAVDSAERAASTPRLSPLVARSGVRECSFAQQRFWFVDQVMGTAAAYNIPVGLRLRGELNAPLLERALSEIVRRHEILRTHFADQDGRPVQVVAPARPFSLPLLDLTGLEKNARDAAARRAVDRRTQESFELTEGLLFSAHLIRMNERDHILHFVFNHLVFDGWSKVVLFREFSALYNAYARGEGSPLEEIAVQYGDFAEWQRSWLEGEVLERELEHWRDALAGSPAAVELPTDRPRPQVSSMRGAWSRSSVPAETVKGLQELARQEGVTVYMALLAVFDILLARYSGQDDVVVGMPVDSRDQSELDGSIGVFVDTVVLRVDLSGGITFRQALDRVRTRMLDAIAHQRLPFEQLVRALEPDRMLGRHPLYQVMLTLVPAAPPLQLSGLEVDEVATERASSPIDLTVFLEPRGDTLDAIWEYSTDLFDGATIERMQSHFVRLLDAAVAEPERRIDELALLTDEERRATLDTWTRTGGGPYPVACLHELFQARAAATPDAAALTYEQDTLSYSELNRRANRLAHRLRALGVGPEVPVALCLERSLNLVVAILAVLKAGGAYVPLDPDYPAERIGFVLSDTGAPVVLTQEELLPRLPPHNAAVVCLDRDNEALTREISDDPDPLATPESLAYIIYTSGSTGQPKGVQVEHRQVARLFTATEEWFSFGRDDTWLLFHSYAFDFSVWELWGALLHGGRLVVAPLWTTRSPQALAGLLVDEAVTVLNATPSLFIGAQEALVQAAWDLDLRVVVLGGEALQPAALKPWFARFPADGPRLVNMYGITETTVHVTYRPLTAADCEHDSSPIGRPLPDLQLFVLDAAREPVPPGAPGELYVGGAGVSRGYLNRPKLNAERFIPNPFGPGRLYRTGDSARHRIDGEVEYLGRIDDQVKIRGFRIELGEIQAALAANDAVAECAVVAHEVAAGDTRLAAYIVLANASLGDADAERLRGDLRADLEQRLPSFMVPASLTLLDGLPLTSNGKLDRKRLPAPAWEEQSDAAFVPPQTEAENRIAEIWREILGVERVGAHDNFFHVGGHSLLAARVVTRVRERFSTELSVRALFEHPTLAAFAAHVAGATSSKRSDQQAHRDGAPATCPPSFPQQQLLFIDKLAPSGVATYNGAFAVRIAGALDLDALEGAFVDVIQRHEALHTVFAWEADGPVQMALRDWQAALPLVDLVAVPAGRREEELRLLMREAARQPFDLARDLLVRAMVFRLDAEEHVLLVMTHHIASDGWSVGVFCRDLGELYTARRERRSPNLPELQCRYTDFVHWQRERLQGERLASELAYWQGHLAGAPTTLPLPADRPRPSQLTFDGEAHELLLPRGVADDVLRVCRQRDVTPYMLLLGVFGVLLYRITGQDDILVSGPFANRSRTDFDDLVGFFANTLVVRLRLGGNPAFAEVLARVREATLGAFEHQEVPFEHIVEAMHPRRDPGMNPLAQVNFRVRVDAPAKPELAGTMTSRVPVEIGFAAFDLALDLHLVEHEGIVGEFLFNTQLFDRATVERLASDYEELLRQIIAQPEARLLALELASEREPRINGAAPRASIRRFRQT